jgi:hypothetical protein
MTSSGAWQFPLQCLVCPPGRGVHRSASAGQAWQRDDTLAANSRQWLNAA